MLADGSRENDGLKEFIANSSDEGEEEESGSSGSDTASYTEGGHGTNDEGDDNPGTDGGDGDDDAVQGDENELLGVYVLESGDEPMARDSGDYEDVDCDRPDAEDGSTFADRAHISVPEIAACKVGTLKPKQSQSISDAEHRSRSPIMEEARSGHFSHEVSVNANGP